jgi:hypothetical protein
MELSRTIASMAIVLGVLLAAGYAFGEGAPAPAQGATAPGREAEREAARKVALAEQQKRKETYERACNRPLKTEMDWDLCRTAYKRLMPEK